MTLRSFISRAALAAAFVASSTAIAGCAAANEEDSSSSAAQTQQRPKQFVILAFDGSSNLSFWRESRAFARANDLKFTYFINPAYFVTPTKKSVYDAPRNGVGKSAIGWGGEPAVIGERLEEVRLAHAEGHEIGSHAVGHWDGSTWSEADWQSEFDQFDDIFFRAAEINGIRAVDLGFGPRDLVGFRAPQLGHSPGLFKVLPRKGYAYDTSKTAQANYWPRQTGGVWNFPLAMLRIQGSNKATLSMDYNFYVADSRAEPNAANKETFKRQMIDTYMKYFQDNYFGNRAPVHIGHHFSKWNGGAYWEAMQTFAQRVCGLPEVQCGTYKELLAFVQENEGKLADYQAGNFQKMARPPGEDDSTGVEQIDPREIAVAEDAHAHDE